MTDELLTLMRDRIAIGLEREKTMEAIEGWERTALLMLKEGPEYHFIVKDNNITVAHAVSASAAYPVFLPAHDDNYRFQKGDKSTTNAARTVITDGGVYDNLGTESLFKFGDDKFRKEINFLIVSDASKKIQTTSYTVEGGYFYKENKSIKRPDRRRSTGRIVRPRFHPQLCRQARSG